MRTITNILSGLIRFAAFSLFVALMSSLGLVGLGFVVIATLFMISVHGR